MEKIYKAIEIIVIFLLFLPLGMLFILALIEFIKLILTAIK